MISHHSKTQHYFFPEMHNATCDIRCNKSKVVMGKGAALSNTSFKV